LGKKLTVEQVEAFERDGFVSPVDIFSQEEALMLRKEFERAEKKWPEAFQGAARSNAHLVIRCLDEIVYNQNLLDAVEDLVGPDIINYGTVLFVKEPRDSSFVSWHQDAKYMGLEPHIGITAWIALSDSNNESGCMQMIPGSHSHMKEHYDTFGEDNILTRGQEIQEIDEAKTVSTPLRPGQASFHSVRVIHSSQPNKSNDRRIGFVIQTFMSPSVTQTKSRVAAQLVRGKDNFGNFDVVGRPERDMNPKDIASRDKINSIWAEHLYEGAEKKRDL